MYDKVQIVQDVDKAISVMLDAGHWLEESGKKPSKWWQPQNLNREFLLKYAKKDEFYAVVIDGKPAAAEILQFTQDAQDWRCIDHKPQKAIYIHWLCVHRDFAGKGLTKIMVDFAAQKANEAGVKLIRVDTNADESKLRQIYEKLGFKLVGIVDEDYRRTAFYQKSSRMLR